MDFWIKEENYPEIQENLKLPEFHSNLIDKYYREMDKIRG